MERGKQPNERKRNAKRKGESKKRETKGRREQTKEAKGGAVEDDDQCGQTQTVFRDPN